MTTLAHRSALRRTEKRRRRRPPRGRPLGRAHVPPRVAAAAPGGDAPHGRRRGRDRQHHDRLQLGPRRQQRLRLGQPRCSRSTAPIRESSRPASPPPRESFGTIDVIGHRSVSVPGSVETVDYRAQDPGGAYGGELLALRQRQLPGGPARGRRHRRGGGAPAARDRVDPGARRPATDRRRHRREPEQAERRVRSRLALFRERAGPRRPARRRERRGRRSTPSFGPGPEPGTRLRGLRAARERPAAAETLAMFSVATVFLLLASLVAAAGFAVVAQRRLRQLGMLAAVGATEKHLRLVLLTNGAVVGTIAAVIGTIVGLALWLVVRPDARVRGRPSHRPAQPSVGADRDGRPARNRRGNRRRLVAGANGRPPPRPARALGTTAQAEAGAALGDRGRSADRGRHRLSRAVRPGQPAAHRRRALGDDPRQPAPRPAGDPHLLRRGRASLDRAATGAAGPGPLPGPVRSRARRRHARARHRGDGRRHRLGRGGEEGE